MAVATTDQIKTRIETMADAIVTTLLTGNEERIARSTLPAIEVRAGADTNERHGATGRLVTRQWQLWLLVAEIINPEQYADLLPATEACHPFLDSIPDYFMARPQLQNAAMASPLVYGTGLMDSSGPVKTPYKGATYTAVRFTFDVTTMRP